MSRPPISSGSWARSRRPWIPGSWPDSPTGASPPNIFEGLAYRDGNADLRLRPGVARAWDVSEDGLTYTFHLRPEARWSDGRPVTAHDFTYAWTRVLTPSIAARYATLLYPVENAEAFNRGDLSDPARLGFRAVDDTTFMVRLHSPCAYFLDLCAFYTLLPVPRWTIEAHGDAWIKPGNIVSNGPFLLTEWTLNRRIRLAQESAVLERGVDRARRHRRPHQREHQRHFNLYMSGVLDWADAGAVPLFVVPDLLERADFHVAPYFNTYFYRFNVTRPPLDDVRVRQAICLATDRDAITRYVTRAGQVPAYSLVPPGLPGYTIARQPERNVEEARRLLAEAGYPEGRGFPQRGTPLQHVGVAQADRRGAAAAMEGGPGGRHPAREPGMEGVPGHHHRRSTTGWPAGDGSATISTPTRFSTSGPRPSGNNRTGFADPEYDALIARAARTLDPEARLASAPRGGGLGAEPRGGRASPLLLRDAEPVRRARLHRASRQPAQPRGPPAGDAAPRPSGPPRSLAGTSPAARRGPERTACSGSWSAGS